MRDDLSPKLKKVKVGKVKSHTGQGDPPGQFLKHEATESIATPPPGWDASPSQGYPQQYVADTHSIHLGGERQCGAKYVV